jgi:hypothetical protein
VGEREHEQEALYDEANDAGEEADEDYTVKSIALHDWT